MHCKRPHSDILKTTNTRNWFCFGLEPLWFWTPQLIKLEIVSNPLAFIKCRILIKETCTHYRSRLIQIIRRIHIQFVNATSNTKTKLWNVSHFEIWLILAIDLSSWTGRLDLLMHYLPTFKNCCVHATMSFSSCRYSDSMSTVIPHFSYSEVGAEMSLKYLQKFHLWSCHGIRFIV